MHVQPSLADPCEPDGGIPREMTGIATKLKSAGYETHQVGKWDAGMATPDHTPAGRGYDTSLGYFGHGNWMWSMAEWQGSAGTGSLPPIAFVDFWDTDKPASSLNGTDFEEWIYRRRLEEILDKRDESKPLFLFYAPRVAHYPLQAPPEYQAQFKDVDEPHRLVYHAMVKVLDDQLDYLTGLYKSKGLWNNTLMVLSSDNGGFTKGVAMCNETVASMDPNVPPGISCFNLEAGANNYPLRGGKYSSFEGGVRVNAFVSGGFLPKAVRGTTLEEMITVADWYATFSGLAGVDPEDPKAKAAGLPPIDSLDMWPLLSGQNATSPRTEYFINSEALISGKWKLLTGTQKGSGWGGPRYPNISSAGHEVGLINLPCTPACLFDVESDRTEHNDVASENPDIVSRLEARLNVLKQTILLKNRTRDKQCKVAAREKYGGFIGPWLD